jgi:hypothetical protein
MGVLAGKDFLVLDCKTVDDDDGRRAATSQLLTRPPPSPAAETGSDKKQSSADAVELLPCRVRGSHRPSTDVSWHVRNRVTGSLEAVEVSASGLAEDEREVTMARLSSARSGQKTALETWTTPDANTVVQLHMRVQVIDVVREEIVYSPRSTDRIQRVTTATVLQQQQQQQQGVKYSTNQSQV